MSHAALVSVRARGIRGALWCCVALGLTAGRSTLFAAPPAAAPPTAAPQAASLDLVPANAAFYTCSLRLKEQFEIARDSKAWEKFKTIPSVQLGLKMLDDQWNNPNGLGFVQQLMELPENQQLADLLLDMISSEVFVYGDASLADTAGLVVDAMNSARIEQFLQALQDAREGEMPKKKRGDTAGARSVLRALSENLSAVKVPPLVIGFRTSQQAAAKTQLKRLEVLSRMALAQQPDLKQRLKRSKIGEGEYLVLSLDGSLVPWDQVPIARLEEEPGEFNKLLEHLKQMTLVLSIGVQGDYVLVSIAGSNDHLLELGKGELLGKRAEMKPLAKFFDQRLTSVAFVSEALRSRIELSKRDVDEMVAELRRTLPDLDLDDALSSRIVKDAQQLADDLKSYVPKLAPMLAFSFLTPRGQESYRFDWSENLLYDGTQSLGLLEHVGRDPVAFYVLRTKYDPGQYDLLAKWAQVAYGYVEELVLPQMEVEDRANFQQIVATAGPLLTRFNTTTRKKLLPALADGQSAFVLDAKITSKQWHKDMPPSKRPLPMLEPALVIGVKDAEQLKQAFAEYRAIANEALDQIRAAKPGSLPPDFKIPSPETEQLSGGTSYFYRLPADAGLDAQVVPNAGLTKKLAVLSLAQSQTEALLAATPLKLPPTLGEAGRPLVSAGHFDWAALVDAVSPWLEYGARYASGQQAAGVLAPGGALVVGGKNKGELADELDPQSQMILDQVQTALEILKVWRGVTTVSYEEQGALVTHGEVRFEDLK